MYLPASIRSPLFFPLLMSAAVATGCGATRSRLDAVEPWEYATRAAEHPPAAIEVVKPKVSQPPIPEELPDALKERVTLRSEAVEIRGLLLGLAKQTGLNIALDPDVTGQVSAYFNDAPVIDVLRNIGEQLGADVEVRAGSVSVHRPRNEFRVFRLHYLRGPRAGQTNMGILDRAMTNLGAAGGQQGGAMGMGAMGGGMGAMGGMGAGGAGGAAATMGGIALPPMPPGGGSMTQVVSYFASSFWEDLGAELTAIVFDGVSDKELTKNDRRYAGLAVSDPSGRSLVIDSMSGTIQVRTRRPILDAVGDYLEAVDRTIQRQVVVDIRILEVSLSDGKTFGIEGANVPFLPSDTLSSVQDILGPTGFTGSRSAGDDTNSIVRDYLPTQGIRSGYTTPLGFPDPNVPFNDLNPAGTPSERVYGFSLFDEYTGAAGNNFPFRLLVQMLGRLGDVKVITAPRLTALHNQKAVLKVVRDRVFYIVQGGTFTPATATSPAIVTAPTVTPYTVPEGIIMDFTPVIDDNGGVTMEIHPAFSSIINEKQAPANSGSQPEVERREFQTTVRVQGEQTVVLGGLISERTTRVETGIPYLKDIPILGNLFRTTTDAQQKSEIIILLTPRVQGAKLLREYVDEFRAISGQKPMKSKDEKSGSGGEAQPSKG